MSAFYQIKFMHSMILLYPWEKYEALYPPSYGLDSTTTVFLELCFGIK